MKDFVSSNRKFVFDILKEGEGAVLFSGNAPIKAGDEFYPYTPNRNFYYLTGIGSPNIILLMVKTADENKEMLFVERPDPDKEKWVGAVLSDKEAETLSGVKEIYFKDSFEEKLSDFIFNKRIGCFYFDLEKRDIRQNSYSADFADKLKRSYPYIEIKYIYPHLAEKRSVKTEEEITNIKKAIEITKSGLYSMMKNVRPNMYEYEAEAYFDFELKKAGVYDKAFATIAAGGANAAVLHYCKNNCLLKDGDLLLCDCGATYNYYSGDITRTFPVNGKFSRRQRDIYRIVLEGNYMIQSEIKAGVPFKSLNEKLKSYYAKELKAIGLIKLPEDVSKYYWHNVSHLLGLETHDAGRHNEGLLKEGMVLTVEPGLYLAQEGIGVRIEDDVAVRKNSCENLSADIIKEIDDIEEFMK